MKTIKDLFKKPLFYVSILSVFAILYVGYAFLGIQTTHVDGESMSPTLDNGQVLFVDAKPATYEYGDVVVLHSEAKGQIVKRIIGLPGDTMKFKNHMVYRNGKLVSEFHDKKAMKHMEMPNEVDYKVHLADGKTKDKEAEYYVMGDKCSIGDDNQTVSVDSIHLVSFTS